jgi:hypothetical protein
MIVDERDTTNVCLVLLDWLRLDWQECGRVLQPIELALRESTRHIEHVRVSDDKDHYEAVCDEEASVIENLLGCAFVVCQTQITSLVVRVRGLHRYFEKAHPGRRLTTTNATKGKLMCTRSAVLHSSDYTEVETVDALANYFKHRDEWPRDWNKLKKPNEKRTARIVLSAGGDMGSTGNLSVGAEALGIDERYSLRRLSNIMMRWRIGIHHLYQAELQNEGVL